MATALHILHLEDHQEEAKLVRGRLCGYLDCNIVHVDSRAKYEAALDECPYDLILADYILPDLDGLQALEIARTKCPDTPFLFVTTQLTDDRAVEALRHGATDFIVKDRFDRLVPAVKRAVEEARARRERMRAERSLKLLLDASALLSSSLDVRATLSTITKLAIVDLADWCIVDLRPEVAKGADTVAVAARNHRLLALTHQLRQRYPIDGSSLGGPARVISTARAEIHEDVNDALLVARARDSEHLSVLRSLGIRSFMTVPMRAGRRTLGAITFISTRDHHHYDAHDLETAQDLADRAAVAIDNALLHAELQSGLREREELMRIVSHDLRTPLGYIATSSSLLRESLPPDQTRAAQWADGIARSASQMQRLISDLLDMAKLDSGTLQLARVAMRLRGVVDELFEQLAYQAKQKGVALVNEVDEGILLDADRDRMAQIIGNLVANAIKFTRAGGRVTVGAHQTGNMTHISVVDTGIGMAPEELAHLFEPYWQGSHRDTQGVGLGLSIVARLIRAHGGSVNVTSSVGNGTTFAITLPNSATHEPEAPVITTPPCVLVVDDDLAIRMSVGALLESHGYRVELAANGVEALEKLRDHAAPRPSLILLDVMMPVMDGMTFRAEQERDHELCDIPVVVFSAYGDVAETAVKMHAVGHLQKPLRAGDLLATIERAAKN
jgi:signal transduction histidine kinase